MMSILPFLGDYRLSSFPNSLPDFFLYYAVQQRLPVISRLLWSFCGSVVQLLSVRWIGNVSLSFFTVVAVILRCAKALGFGSLLYVAILSQRSFFLAN